MILSENEIKGRVEFYVRAEEGYGLSGIDNAAHAIAEEMKRRVVWGGAGRGLGTDDCRALCVESDDYPYGKTGFSLWINDDHTEVSDRLADAITKAKGDFHVYVVLEEEQEA